MPYVVVVAFFAFLAIVLLVPVWLNYRSRERALRIIAESVQAGRPLEPAIIDRMLARPRRNVGKGFALLNLALGVLHFCVGVALTINAYSYAVASTWMTGAIVNLCIGFGLVTMGSVAWRAFVSSERNGRQWGYAGVFALICLYFGVVGLSVGTGLGLDSLFDSGGAESLGAARFTGALVNACYGTGLTVLGVVILRMSRGVEIGSTS